ncbi:MAG: hypothetical protein WAN86_02790 [Hyphomicrobiaceae bacterium]
MWMQQIPDGTLKLADIPRADADWDEIGEFALTYNGYKASGSFEACAEVADAQRHGSLAELRVCLFFEKQRWHHFGRDPDEEAMAYIRSIVEKVRVHVAARG